jgi:hypothetical protein
MSEPIISWEQADQIIQDQRAEIAKLKDAIRRLADQDATLSVQGGNVAVTLDATLTAEERQAIRGVANFMCDFSDLTAADETKVTLKKTAATLRKLLERLG